MSTDQNTPESIPPIIASLTDDEVKSLQEIFKHLLDHIAKRIEYTEARRNQQAVMSGAIVAASVALLTLVLNRIDYFPLFLALLTWSISGILVGATVWFIYARQTNFRYPFTSITKTWKWFYRYALSNYQAFNSPWYALQSKKAYKKGQTEFQTQWEAFREKQIDGLKNPRLNLFQDLQQIYLLHVNERYKNLFLTHLRSVISYGLLSAFLFASLAFTIGLCLQRQPILKGNGSYSNNDIAVHSSWLNTKKSRSIGIRSDEVQMLLNMQIKNQTANSLAVRSIIARDSSGMQLPIFVESIDPTPLEVLPNSTTDAVSMVWIPQALIAHIDHFEVGP